jgi:hypothetical protein
MSWQNEEQVLDMLLIRLSLVGVYRQEDRTFPTQQCTHGLHRYSLYPHRPQEVQALQPADRQHRVQVCRWLVERPSEDAEFVSRVLWTEGAHFAQMTVVHTQNIHYWAHENLQFTRERESGTLVPQCVGVIGDCIMVHISYLKALPPHTLCLHRRSTSSTTKNPPLATR